MNAYYNEIDPYAAEWLRNLIAAGHIAPGDVDERSIEDVRPDELRGYTQVHLFAGIGGWSFALRMAGWPDDRPAWTGSCPCQPFSVAGRGGGTTDARHLWPEMRRLIAECKPEVVFGEQVASAAVVGKAGGKANAEAGPVWLDGVFTDLEAAGYSTGACVLPAAGVGAPHIRQRLWWVADRAGGGQREHGGAPGQPGHADQRGASERLADAEDADRGRGECRAQAGVGPDGERGIGPRGSGDHGGLVYPERDGRGPDQQGRGSDRGAATRGAGAGCGMGDASGTGPFPAALGRICGGEAGPGARDAQPERRGSHWGNTWLQCSDGTARRVVAGVPPLAHGLPRRVDELRSRLERMGVVPDGDVGAILKAARRCRKGVLKGMGNAIVPQVASEFIRAYMETRENA